MLVLAGDWRWLPGWIVGGWFVAVSASTITWLARRDPGLLAERYRMPGTGGQSRRDQRIIYLVTVGFVAWIALMPLDARRFHWTPPLPLVVALVGEVFLGAGRGAGAHGAGRGAESRRGGAAHPGADRLRGVPPPGALSADPVRVVTRARIGARS